VLFSLSDYVKVWIPGTAAHTLRHRIAIIVCIKRRCSVAALHHALKPHDDASGQPSSIVADATSAHRGPDTGPLPAMNESNFGSSLSAARMLYGRTGRSDRWHGGRAPVAHGATPSDVWIMSALRPRRADRALSSSAACRKSFRRLFPSGRPGQATHVAVRSPVTSGTVFHSRTVTSASSAPRFLPRCRR